MPPPLLPPLDPALPEPTYSSPIVAAAVMHSTIAPPLLPNYTQPPCPQDGYLWVPGHWLYGPMGYYWVPGTWVDPPETGALWTPGYWQFAKGNFEFNPGYWGPHVGFYGGVDYGYGYPGSGFDGGHWNDGAFFYNAAVTSASTATAAHTYVETIGNRSTGSKVSYSGGPGGLRIQATAVERMAAFEANHTTTKEQQAHTHAAAQMPALALQNNEGHPVAEMAGVKSSLSPVTTTPHDPIVAPPALAAKLAHASDKSPAAQIAFKSLSVPSTDAQVYPVAHKRHPKTHQRAALTPHAQKTAPPSEW